ncbi:MAG TPA: ATP-binding SpoIIE family protein phosphatase [Kineosporiaceae bacterium]
MTTKHVPGDMSPVRLPGGIEGRDGAAAPRVSMPGLVLALSLVAFCYLLTVALSPKPLYGAQPTLGISLNAGVISALSVLPSRRHLPAFFLAVVALSVVVLRSHDARTFRLALAFAAANLAAVWFFRALVVRFADGGRRPDTRRHLLALFGCGATGVAANAAVVWALTRVASSAGWVPASLVPSTGFLLGVRPAAMLDGTVTIMPLILVLAQRRPRSWPWRSWLEIAAWLVILIVVCGAHLEFSGSIPVGPLLLMVSFAGLVFAVLRLGTLAAAVLSPAFGVLAAVVLLATAPPDGARLGTTLTMLLLSQVAGFVAALLAWATSTVVTERGEALRLAQAEAAAQAALTSLQTALLPPVVTSGPGVQVAARYRAADASNQIGGDWYDTITLPSGGMALVIGDVEGHDLTAASVMGLVRGAVRCYALEGQPPSMVLDRVSTFLVSAGIDRLVTMAYAELAPQGTFATIALGGHPPPLLVPQDGEARLLQVRAGPLLGVEGLGQWPEQTIRLPHEAALVLYTDGLTDFPGAGRDPQDRLVRVATGAGDAAVDVLATALVSNAPSYDDAAVLAARITRRSAGAVQRTFPAQPASAGIARTWLEDVLGLWQAPQPGTNQADEVVEAARLLLTELIANAVRHGDGAIRVRLLLPEQRLRVEVEDASERMPVMRIPEPDADAAGGRGLLLVDTLADGWGVRVDEHAKVVWFELHLAGPSSPTAMGQTAAWWTTPTWPP